MDVHQLELCNAADQHWMDVRVCVQPGHQFSHQRWDIIWRGWRIDRLPGRGVDHGILHPPVFTGRRRTASHPNHQAPMDFADQVFGDRPAVMQIAADELEGIAVIQQFLHVIRIGSGHPLPASKRSACSRVSRVPSICVV